MFLPKLFPVPIDVFAGQSGELNSRSGSPAKVVLVSEVRNYKSLRKPEFFPAGAVRQSYCGQLNAYL